MLTTSTAIDTYAITEGFGKHIEAVPPPSVLILSMLIPVSSVFSLLGAAWSKTSFALTLLRITDSYVRTAIWIIIGTLNLALMVNAILPFARCVPASRGWSRLTEGSCWFSLEVGISYSVFAGVYSAAMDILLALIPWAIILHLRMKTKEKIGVALCMSLGFVYAPRPLLFSRTLQLSTNFARPPVLLMAPIQINPFDPPCGFSPKPLHNHNNPPTKQNPIANSPSQCRRHRHRPRDHDPAPRPG